MIDLSGRVALVTGGSRGIGRACVLRLAEAGADVIINYIAARSAAEEVAAAVLALGRRTAVVKADVAEPEDVAAMMDFVKETFGTLDILVSNAATGGFRPLLTTTPHQFEVAMSTNVGALIVLMQTAMPLLERSAGGAKVIALGATKAALESLIRHFALEVGKRGINVNAVQAGLVDTDSIRQIPYREQILGQWQARSLVADRRLEDRHVADAVVYLASPLSDMIQGHVLVVDAGALVHV